MQGEPFKQQETSVSIVPVGTPEAAVHRPGMIGQVNQPLVGVNGTSSSLSNFPMLCSFSPPWASGCAGPGSGWSAGWPDLKPGQGWGWAVTCLSLPICTVGVLADQWINKRCLPVPSTWWDVKKVWPNLFIPQQVEVQPTATTAYNMEQYTPSTRCKLWVTTVYIHTYKILWKLW